MDRVRAAGAVAVLALAGGGWAVPAQAAAPSTTTLVLSSPASAYGQPVTASVQVMTNGPADGDVFLGVDGVETKINLTGGGAGTLVLPRALVGEHRVTARFVPRLPGQDPSTSPPQSWVVTQVRTRLQVRVTGRGVRIPTSVVVAASGEYGTRPTGQVTVTARHLGTGRTTRREKTLEGAGTVLARLGTLRAGSYRLRVSYAGDAQHLAQRYSERFTVRQR